MSPRRITILAWPTWRPRAKSQQLLGVCSRKTGSRCGEWRTGWSPRGPGCSPALFARGARVHARPRLASMSVVFRLPPDLELTFLELKSAYGAIQDADGNAFAGNKAIQRDPGAEQ
jgi:hypothetical protein